MPAIRYDTIKTVGQGATGTRQCPNCRQPYDSHGVGGNCQPYGDNAIIIVDPYPKGTRLT